MEVRKVLNLMDKNKIISLYLQGYNKSEIERQTGKTRPTIRKYISEYEEYVQAIEQAATLEEKEELIIKSNAKPKYNTENRRRYKVTDKLINRVRELIEKNEELERLKKRKLMMKKKDIFNIIKDEGYDVGYRTICDLIDGIKPKHKEAFIRQEVGPGEIAEFDWGEVTLNIEEMGGERRFKIGVFTLKNSDYVWANLYPLENTECFLDAHARYIEDIGGVPREIVYDNARVQVKQFVGRDKYPSDALLTLTNYYGYNYRFTNAYSGNEKGHVERSVEVVRRKAYCEVQCFKTFADAVAALKKAVEKWNNDIKQRTGKSATAAFAEEQKSLQTARVRLDVGTLETRKVNKYSFIYVDANFYSVPDYLVEKEVTVKKYPMMIKVFYNDSPLLTLERIYGRNEYKVDILHYVWTIKKKPGAIRNSLALKQSSSRLQDIFNQYFITNPKEFTGFLQLIEKYSYDKVIKVIDDLEEQGLKVELSQIEYDLLDYDKVIVEEKVMTNQNIEEQCLNQLKEIENLHYLFNQQGVTA